MSPARRTFNLAPTPDTTGRADDWRDSAACISVDPDLFDPALYDSRHGGKDEAIAQALAVCASCPVRQQCLEANLTDKWLIVGGTTPEQRARMVRNAKRRAVVDEAPHGTPAAYRRHYRRKETPCEACSKAAKRDRKDRYWREREEAS